MQVVKEEKLEFIACYFSKKSNSFLFKFYAKNGSIKWNKIDIIVTKHSKHIEQDVCIYPINDSFLDRHEYLWCEYKDYEEATQLKLF